MVTSRRISNFWHRYGYWETCISTARFGASVKCHEVLGNKVHFKSYLCMLKWVYSYLVSLFTEIPTY
jgi:hypothetical protein